MQNFLKLPLGLLAACLLLAAGPADAAKMPKIDICHFDADEGIYKKSSVSPKALQPHLNHGDVLPGVDNDAPLPDLDEDCFGLAVPDPIARAYIDVDADGAYDGTIDVDIAVLSDTDGTPGLSVGDTLVLGQYPKTFDPCPDKINCLDLGNFNNPTHQVTFVENYFAAFSARVRVGGLTAWFIHDVGSSYEFFTLTPVDSADPNRVNFTDAFHDGFADQLIVSNSPFWNPSDTVNLSRSGGQPDPHVNVIIY